MGAVVVSSGGCCFLHAFLRCQAGAYGRAVRDPDADLRYTSRLDRDYARQWGLFSSPETLARMVPPAPTPTVAPGSGSGSSTGSAAVTAVPVWKTPRVTLTVRIPRATRLPPHLLPTLIARRYALPVPAHIPPPKPVPPVAPLSAADLARQARPPRGPRRAAQHAWTQVCATTS